MRFYLSFLLVLLCVFAKAQDAPPMKLGGPQGIEVNRSLNKFWMSVPIYVDTPVAPLTGSGWPGAGYVIQATKNYDEATKEEWLKWIEFGQLTQIDSIRWRDKDSAIYFLPNGIDSSQALNYLLYGDTSLWHYTGRKWRRVGGNAELYFNYLLEGGDITQVSPVSSRQFIISPAKYFISGLRYEYDTLFRLQAAPKSPDSTGRIDVITISTTGPRILRGVDSRTPYKPKVPSNEIELSTIYFRPFDTIPNVIGGPNGSNVTSIYRLPGKDSIFYTVDTLVFSLKDSVGISTASNGLTAASGNVKLGGSLIENTNINLSSRRLSLISGSDTTRFFANGGVSIGGNALDSTNRLLVRGDARVDGILRLAPTSPSNAAVIRNENSNDGSLAWVGNATTLPANFGARNVIISPSGGYQTTGAQNTFIGRAAGQAVSSGGGNVMIGNNAGQSITTGGNNTFIGAGDSWVNLPSSTSSSIHIVAGQGHDNNRADTVNLGLTGRYALIGGGKFATYVRDYYFGGGHRVRFPNDSHVNFYAPSGWPSVADTIGSDFAINAGRGTGAGLGGSVIFRTSPTTTSGTTLQTLTERARITPRGNVLIGTSTDSTFRLNVSGTARVSDTLTLSTSPATSDTTANDLLVINSSNGHVRRYTGNWPVPSITALNGLTRSNDTIILGGSLNQNTIIKGGNTRNFTLDSLAAFRVRFNNPSFISYGSSDVLSIYGSDFAFLGKPFGEMVGVSSGRAYAQKVSGYIRQGIYVSSDSIYLERGDGITETVSRISSSTTDTAKFKILTINNTTGSLATYTGAWPVAMPTLQQVTTAGNTTTDGISAFNFELNAAGNDFFGIVETGESVFKSVSVGEDGNPKGTILGDTITSIRNIYLPDSSGILTQRVAINGTTYNTASNGVIDMNGLWINGSATLDFPSTNGNTKSDLTITVTGASDGDVVSLGVPNGSVLDHSCYTAWVSATNTVTVRFSNYGTGALDPASGTFKIKVFK